MTACDEEGNVVMGLDMGGDDYITKPFNPLELIASVFSNILIIGIRIIIGAFGKRSGLEAVPEGICVCE